MNDYSKFSIIFSMLLVSGCTSSSGPKPAFLAAMNDSDKMKVEIGFYDISASTFLELDRQIALRGPVVSGVGKAIASTKVRMIPDIKFLQSGEVCKVDKAKIIVNAKVTLPRLNKNKAIKNNELTTAFGNLENYAAMHEAVHVSIARSFAKTAEDEIAGLAPRKNCAALERDAVKKFKNIMADHRSAQLKFDDDEKARFSKNSKSSRIY